MTCTYKLVLLSIIAMLLYFASLEAMPVLNEICYDPTGVDDYFEWVELYNPGTAAIQLQGWKLYSGGSTLSCTYEFPPLLLRPKQYLLLAEPGIAAAQLTAKLDLQNGGSATDGVRLVSPDSLYTDTVLYDEPNSNHLPQDAGGQGYAPDVAEGHSLARRVDGEDSNQASDWIDSALPTPGRSNQAAIHLQLSHCSREIQTDHFIVQATIKNLSTSFVDNSSAWLQISINDTTFSKELVPSINASDSVTVRVSKQFTVLGWFKMSVSLQANYPIVIVDSLWITSILHGPSPLVFSEVLAAPGNQRSEWVELYCRYPQVIHNPCVQIKDAAQQLSSANITINQYVRIILCKSIAQFTQSYPHTLVDNLYELTSLPALNNSHETIYLLSDGIVLDSVSWDESKTDISYERHDFLNDATPQWAYCTDAAGATPTQVNSPLPNVTESDSLSVISCSETATELQHLLQLSTAYLGASLLCMQWNAETQENTLVYENTVTDTLFTVSISKPANGYYGFQYICLQDDELQAETWCYWNDNTIPVAINEIMYNPATGEPEWLELRRNFALPQFPAMYVIITDDTLYIASDSTTYRIITGSSSDSAKLDQTYSLTNCVYSYGLPTLHNTGDAIYLYDQNNNLLDSVQYLPAWGEEKGRSLERILSASLSQAANWRMSTNVLGATPGKANSVQGQIAFTNHTIQVTPQPFYPSKQAQLSIACTFTVPTSQITCTLYDLKGRKLIRLLNLSTDSYQGLFLWDAKNEYKNKVSSGNYVALIEANNTKKECFYRRQKVVVIGY